MIYQESNDTQHDYLYQCDNPKAARIRWMLELPDLTRDPVSPLHYLIHAITELPILTGHDLVEFPEIVSVEKNFDLLGAAPGHPTRSPSDTFYINETHVLRTQTTTMWSYYLRDKEVIARLHRNQRVLALSYGKVYRNDEIDRQHYPVFHQVDGLYLTHVDTMILRLDDLAKILIAIAQGIYGYDIRYRIEDDTFPFTDPSLQLLIERDNQWIEVLGAGLVSKKVLTLLGIDPQQYNGWAFGFGLDRLAMIKMNIPDIRILWSTDERIRSQFIDITSTYQEVSRFPPVDRDISFVVNKDLPLNEIYELMRTCGFRDGEDWIEDVRHIESYRDDTRFGTNRISHTFRIRYRSLLRSLTNEEVNSVQESLRHLVVTAFGAELR